LFFVLFSVNYYCELKKIQLKYFLKIFKKAVAFYRFLNIYLLFLTLILII